MGLIRIEGIVRENVIVFDEKRESGNLWKGRCKARSEKGSLDISWSYIVSVKKTREMKWRWRDKAVFCEDWVDMGARYFTSANCD